MKTNFLMLLAIVIGVILLIGYSNNWLSLILLVIGLAILFFYGTQEQRINKRQISSVSTLPLAVGIIFVCLSLILLPHFWLIGLAFFIGYALMLVFTNSSDKKNHSTRTATDLQYVNVTNETASEADKDNDFFNFKTWFLNQHQGKETFSWKNFQYYSVYGDSLIDLTNTIVPRKTNVIGIHKVVGNIKIIVPTGTGVSLHVNSYRTTLRWQGKQYALQNEKFILENEDYQENPRKIHLIITQGWGNIEVVFL